MAGGGIKVNNVTVRGGADGATFIPSVDSEGNLSWTNNKGYTNPTPVNIKGQQGEKGDKGEQGLQGIQGLPGEKGEQGIQGIPGETSYLVSYSAISGEAEKARGYIKGGEIDKTFVKKSDYIVYHHGINMEITWHNFGNDIESIYFEFYDNNSAKYTIDTVNTLITKVKGRGIFNCVGGGGELITGQITVRHTGIKFEDSGSNVNITLYDIPFSISMSMSDIIGANGAEITSFIDTVTEV